MRVLYIGGMYAYIDESHSDSGKAIGGDIYYIGALLVDDEQVRFIDQKLSELRDRVHQRFGVPADVEFHGHCMFQYKYGWERMKGLHSQSAGIYRAAMRILAESGAQIIIRWCVGQLSGSFDMLRGHHQGTSCWTASHIRGI